MSPPQETEPWRRVAKRTSKISAPPRITADQAQHARLRKFSRMRSNLVTSTTIRNLRKESHYVALEIDVGGTDFGRDCGCCASGTGSKLEGSHRGVVGLVGNAGLGRLQ